MIIALPIYESNKVWLCRWCFIISDERRASLILRDVTVSLRPSGLRLERAVLNRVFTQFIGPDRAWVYISWVWAEKSKHCGIGLGLGLPSLPPSPLLPPSVPPSAPPSNGAAGGAAGSVYGSNIVADSIGETEANCNKTSIFQDCGSNCYPIIRFIWYPKGTLQFIPMRGKL